MKRIIAALLAFLMLLALSACGSKTPAESPTFDGPAPTVELERTPDPTPAPQAVVDPEEIEWGYQAPGISDTQYWYVDGDKSATSFLFFEDGCLTMVDGETRR